MKQRDAANLFDWADSRPSAEVFNLDEHREKSARWRLVIEPRAIDPVETFDRMIGLLPRPPVITLDDIRLQRPAKSA